VAERQHGGHDRQEDSPGVRAVEQEPGSVAHGVTRCSGVMAFCRRGPVQPPLRHGSRQS
jgi:hypothetical protein